MKFNLYGGLITGCTDAYLGGGAVCAYTRYPVAFRMTGGVITNCSASSTRYGYGGAFLIYSTDAATQFEFTSGTVSGNSAKYGVGMMIFQGGVTVADGFGLYNNTASAGGDDIYSNGASVTLGTVVTGAELDGCGDPITDWYEDAESRWSYESCTGQADHLEVFAHTGELYTEEFGLKAAHGELFVISSVVLKKTYVGASGYDNEGNPVSTEGTLTGDVSFKIEAYKSFNREVGKTDVPAFNPGVYTIAVGSGSDEVTVDLPDYSASGVGDYWYKVTEIPGSTVGVRYDGTEYYLHVSVIHKGSSDAVGQVQLHKEAPADDGSYANSADEKTDSFTNEYGAGTLTVEKNVTGNMADAGKSFDVVVTFTAPEGKTVSGDVTYGVNKIDGGWTGRKHERDDFACKRRVGHL